MKYNNIITLLKEFDYDKNSKEDTAKFLVYVLYELIDIKGEENE